MQTVDSNIQELSTQALEKYIDSRYEAGAPQDELDALEVEYSKRVSEEDLNMREAHEMGIDLEEWLANEYDEFIHPEKMAGGREAKDFFNPCSFNDFMTLNLKPGIKRKDIMAAAKDIYEYRRNLIQRQRSSHKLSNIPYELLNRKGRFNL